MKKFIIFLVATQSILFAQISTCDKLAGNPLDKAAIFKGISFKQIEPAKAIATCKKELKQNPNNVRILYQLGRAYDANKQYKKALKLYKKACRSNYAIACVGVGLLNYYGRGTSKNYKKAVKFFKKACRDKRDVGGCANAGMAYEYEKGVEVNSDIALLYYAKACQRGYDYGCRLYNHLNNKMK